MRASILFLASVATVVGAPPSIVSGAGIPLPIDGVFGRGVISADGDHRFVAAKAGERTLVMRIATDGGEVEDYVATRGTYAVPAVAQDATASGVSANGKTLALVEPRRSLPRKRTDLEIYDPQRLQRAPTKVTLRGDYNFDALSPDGKTLYLLEYPDPTDPGEYRVRAYDLQDRELEPEPILDPNEEPDEMRGLAQTRVTSPDGRWEYTLYDGGGAQPFIHALDVVDAATVCIDLDMLKGKQTYGASLAISEDGQSIELTVQRGDLRAIVDRDTHVAREPHEEPPAAAVEKGLDSAGIAVGALVLVSMIGFGIRRMRN